MIFNSTLVSSDPQIMTIATLTGHAVLANGNYSAIMDNGPAKAAGTALKVQEAGDKIGDMFEITTVRREDWDFIKGRLPNDSDTELTPSCRQVWRVRECPPV